MVLRPGDDLRQLAADAVARGADVIGMAGGDGSQALVASVAAEHDVAHVCIPAGTRNHFALDLGLDRDDVVAPSTPTPVGTSAASTWPRSTAGCSSTTSRRGVRRDRPVARLPRRQAPDHDDDAAGPARSHRRAVRRALRRSRTAAATTAPRSSRCPTTATVADQPHRVRTRARLDEGVLGIAAAHITRDTQVASFVALEATGRLDRFDGWREWTAPTFTVDSGAPVAAGVDGEALRLEPPLEFRSWPAAVRVRVPTHAPGRSPAATVEHRGILGTVTALLATAVGRSG
ncbi:MAG: diacylglycerol kinase family protein [Acidimicrobiales bacterium]